MSNDILKKPNKLIEGIMIRQNAKEMEIFNQLLHKADILQYNTETNKVDITSDKIIVSLSFLKDLINDPKYVTRDNVLLYLRNKFMHDTISIDTKDKIIVIPLLKYLDVNKNTLMYEMQLNDKFIELLGLKQTQGFTPIKLGNNTNNFNAKVIYEHIKKWSPIKNSIEFQLDNFKEMLGISNKYTEYKDLKKRVITPLVKELNDKFNINVSIEEVKLEKKVWKLIFNFIDRERICEKNSLKSSLTIINPTLTENIINEEIDSIDYVKLIDMNINESIHSSFIKDFYYYKNYISAVDLASTQTLKFLGGKTINKRNYKYFKTTLENLIPDIEF